MPLRYWLLVLILFVVTACLHAGPLDEALAKAHPEGLLHGHGICLFDRKGELWSSCAGYANEAKEERFTCDTGSGPGPSPSW
jgi:hypothetical protein